MNMRVKKLFAIHRDSDYKIHRTKIAEGTTADFAAAIGFQIEDFNEERDGDSQGVEHIGLNGTYPALQEEAFRHFEGKLLTLADATFTNKTQCDAFKKLISDRMWTFFQEEVRQTIDVYERKDNPRLRDTY
jgi:hypothetical protein